MIDLIVILAFIHIIALDFVHVSMISPCRWNINQFDTLLATVPILLRLSAVSVGPVLRRGPTIDGRCNTLSPTVDVKPIATFFIIAPTGGLSSFQYRGSDWSDRQRL